MNGELSWDEEGNLAVRVAHPAVECRFKLPPASRTDSKGGFFDMEKMNRGQPRLSTGRLVLLGMMIALNVLLGRFSIQVTGEIRVSVLGFLPIALSGMLMGPMYGAMTGAAGDIINYLLFTHVWGPYFPGYTLTALLSGAWYGLVLKGRKVTWLLAAIAIVPVILIGEMGLNSVWVWLMYRNTFWANLPMRLLTNAIECPIKMALLVFLARGMERFPQKYLKI